MPSLFLPLGFLAAPISDVDDAGALSSEGVLKFSINISQMLFSKSTCGFKVVLYVGGL
jgi:hypothetical protein